MASVTRSIFRKACNYAYGIFQKGNIVLDADVNDSRKIAFYHLKDVVNNLGWEGFKDNGFEIVQADSGNTTNNFVITAGIGYSQGLRLYLDANANITPIEDTQANLNLCSVISNLTATDLTDNRLNLKVNSAQGRNISIYQEGDDPLKYLVVSNTANTFVVTGNVVTGDDMLSDGVEPNMYYMLEPSTPMTEREDAVLLNVFLDEVSPDEDPELYHNLGGELENERRQKIRTVVEVIQDIDSTTYTVPANYTDLIGNSHHYLLLGYLDRTVSSVIDSSMITDAREPIHELNSYVLKAGDIMTGDLEMSSADINMNGNIISGDALDIDFNLGVISNGGVEIDLDAGTAEGLSLVSTEDLTIVGGIGGSSSRFVRNDTEDNTIVLEKIAVDLSSERANLEVANPYSDNHASTKVYVDRLISGHAHSDYVTKESLGRAYVNDFSTLEIGGSPVGVRWFHGDTLTWEHGLGDSFVLFFMQEFDGTYWGPVEDMETRFTPRIVDADTVEFTYEGGVSGDFIVTSTIRCALMRVHENSVISVSYIDTTGFDAMFTEV